MVEPANPSVQAPVSDVQQPLSQNTQQQVNKSKLPLVLLILGILGIVFISLPAISIMVHVVPQMEQLGSQLQVTTDFNPIVSYGVIVLISLIPITQIFYGLTLINVQKNGILKSTQKRNVKLLIITGIISAIVSMPAVGMFVIWPIYHMVGSIK